MSVTLLVPETSTMEDRRRLQEQDGHRRWHMRMNVRERTEDSATTDPSPEYAVENGIAEHPLLNTQRFDGIAPDQNPLPPLNDQARTKLENELRLQHQKKLEKTNQYTARPAPSLKP